MLDFASVLRSPSFEVLVGPDRICFTIPKSLAQGLSDPLHALMNNANMKESQEGQAIIDDVEVDVFVGFCEFAYTSDYSSRRKQQSEIGGHDAALSAGEAKPAKDAVELEEPLAEQLVVAEDSWDFTPQRKKPKVTMTIPARLWSEFQDIKYKDPSSHQNRNLIAGIKTATSLLYHAKLYVFAERYLIDSLRILCLRKLHAELQSFDLTVQSSEDILEVLEFTYTHTEKKESADDDLRVLVVHYAVCKAEVLKQNTGFRRLLESTGELACDLFYKSW